jgi:predicted adenylyl cyclase CyaB
MRNIEIKARVFNRRHLRDYMRLHGSQQQVQHQRDVFFNAPRGRLKLRCFRDGTGVLVAYDRADQAGPKLSDYTPAPVADAAKCEQALTRSLGVRGIVEKKREIAIVGQTRIHLDQVKGLGVFLELEVVLRPRQSLKSGRSIAKKLMKELNLGQDGLLERAYIDMIELQDIDFRKT